MEIIKLSTDWAKAEIFSSAFFIAFGVLFISASFEFLQIGKSDIAKAFLTPTLVAGSLLLIIGVGLCYANITRYNTFEEAYNQDSEVFIQTELDRTEATLKEYSTIVYKVIPCIIIVAALLIVFINTPTWKAISITTIAMMAVILMIDTTAYGRIINYKKQLDLIETNNTKP